MNAIAAPIPARHRNVNRAEVCDQNFTEFVQAWDGLVQDKPGDDDPVLEGSLCSARDFLELFESQLVSRHLDLMARVLRVQQKVFYTIGSSGHEGNAMVARLTRHTDPAFLHYRSGAFMAERFRKLPGMDPIMDSALSFAASKDDPASGGRHKVWGSKPLWVLPQTSTIASHLPKAFGTAVAIEQARRIGHQLPIPDDSIAICSFGDASSNHATAQTAFNTAGWTAYQKLPAPVLFVCEDNGIGISVKTPNGWIERNFAGRQDLDYFYADGLDLAEGYEQVARAVHHCRTTRRPTFLHLRTTRIMGHAGTDFEIEWRSVEELMKVEAGDPLLRSAHVALASGLYSKESLLAQYEAIRGKCFAAAEEADRRPKITELSDIIAPLAPYTPDKVIAEATRTDYADKRLAVFGSEAKLPENLPPRHLALQINAALHDLFCKLPETLLFGEDVAQKGGVYTVTKGLHKSFKNARVFNTLLDETMILGLAQGFANMGMLPVPEIQYLAYFHNACDQIRGEACSLQFFSNGQYRNPILMRVASLGYQKGFGGHFHNDNSITALRDIPGLVVGCPSRGDDAAMMLRTLAALAKVDGRVCAFLEPIALYMTKDLHAAGDGGWSFAYPPPDQAMVLGEERVYEPAARDLVVFSYGNGVPMSLRAAKQIEARLGWKVRVVDLRWLQPLNEAAIARHAGDCARILVVDEGRRSAGVGEGIITAVVETGHGAKPLRRVVGVDTYTPLAGAALLVLPSEADIVAAAAALSAPAGADVTHSGPDCDALHIRPVACRPKLTYHSRMSATQPCTILFADVSGSTRLFEQKGDVEARRLIAAVLNALTVVCNSHGGRVIKTIGDEVMCTFRGALQGVLAACDMQRKMARDIDFVRDNLGVRIGLHHGEALFEDNDVFGDAVNVAARMTSLAKREQIVTTASSLRELTGPPISVRSLGRARVSGKLLPIEIVDVIWQEDTSGMTTVQRAVRTAAPEAAEPNKLTLRYKDKVIELVPESDPLTLGREVGNGLTVAADWVSRTHATIEYKRGHFVLSDRSTNGTWVKLGEDDELRLSRDEVHLRKSGTISLGKGMALNGDMLVQFDCETRA